MLCSKAMEPVHGKGIAPSLIMGIGSPLFGFTLQNYLMQKRTDLDISQMKIDLKRELLDELKNELKEAIKGELKEELRSELKEELRRSNGIYNDWEILSSEK